MTKVAGTDMVVISGFVTVTLALPSSAIKPAGTVTWIWVLPVREVTDSGVPFHCTVALASKLVPLTVSVKAGPPSVTAGEERLLITGWKYLTWK